MTTHGVSTTRRPQVIRIWPEGAPGSEDWKYPEQEWFTEAPDCLRFIRNVTIPTLTAFYPDPSIANGAAVIVCPGGAHHMLNIDEEGLDMARWLCERGVTSFVLKYRLVRTPENDEEFTIQIKTLFSGQENEKFSSQMKQHGPLAIADGQQAIKVVRDHAAEWGVLPDRIGIMGFSAGGHVAAGVALQHDQDSRPNFAAPIYGALWEEIIVPADAPSLFIAFAVDDEIAAGACLRLYSAWRDAGNPVEMHAYSAGGHGFSTRTQGLPVDSWMDRFGDWLKLQGVLGAAD